VKPEQTCHISTSDSPFSHLYASVVKRPAAARPAADVENSDGKESVRGTATLSSNLTELDNLLAELSSSQFAVPADDRLPADCVYLLLRLLFFFPSPFSVLQSLLLPSLFLPILFIINILILKPVYLNINIETK